KDTYRLIAGLLGKRAVRIVVLAVVVFSVILNIGLRYFFPPLPKSVQVFDVVWLKQGWTDDQREKYYQTSQGSLIIPYSWFFALDQPPTGICPLRIHHQDLFHTNENLP